MHTSSNTTPSGQEPALSAPRTTDRSGAEPMLGGIRRPPADLHRLRDLLDASAPVTRRRAIQAIRDYGQAPVYARELVHMIPSQARHQVGDWQGRLTPGQRQRAIEALAHLGDNDSIAALLDALGDTTYRQIQQAAGRALDAIFKRLPPDDPRTADAYQVMTHTLSHLPLGGRNAIIHIMAQAPDDLALRPLIRHGLTASDARVRREAARALGMCGDRRATKRLVFTLNDPSATVRGSAAWALGQLDAPVSIPALIAAALDEDEVVRAAATEALGAQVGRLDPDDELFKPGLQAVTEMLYDDDVSVRYAALDALKNIDQPQARIALHTLRIRGASRR